MYKRLAATPFFEDAESFDATKVPKTTTTTSKASPSTGALFRAQMLGEGCCGLCWVIHLGGGWLLVLRSVVMVVNWKLVKLVVGSLRER